MWWPPLKACASRLGRPLCLQPSRLPAPLPNGFVAALSGLSAGIPLASLQHLWLERGLAGGVPLLSRALLPWKRWRWQPFEPGCCCLLIQQQFALLSRLPFSAPIATGSMHDWFAAPLVPSHSWFGRLPSPGHVFGARSACPAHPRLGLEALPMPQHCSRRWPPHTLLLGHASRKLLHLDPGILPSRPRSLRPLLRPLLSWLLRVRFVHLSAFHAGSSRRRR
mmetsp:Transcript_5623/g.34876  ORF Transcript_5623/g.34876 Transcript_5623/m.34876 type:complete len:222 (-) Transcript_5623:581-1246(-)